MGFANNQFIAAHHRDTRHSHLYIVANRIGFNGRTVSDSNNYKAIAAYCRKMKLKYELKQVLNPRKFLSKEQRYTGAKATDQSTTTKTFCFEEKLMQFDQAALPAVDIRSVEASIEAAVSEMKHVMQQQSKPIIRECVFYFFPQLFKGILHRYIPGAYVDGTSLYRSFSFLSWRAGFGKLERSQDDALRE